MWWVLAKTLRKAAKKNEEDGMKKENQMEYDIISPATMKGTRKESTPKPETPQQIIKNHHIEHAAINEINHKIYINALRTNGGGSKNIITTRPAKFHRSLRSTYLLENLAQLSPLAGSATTKTKICFIHKSTSLRQLTLYP